MSDMCEDSFNADLQACTPEKGILENSVVLPKKCIKLCLIIRLKLIQHVLDTFVPDSQRYTILLNHKFNFLLIRGYFFI